MITVTFHRTGSAEYIGFICSGHAGFDTYGKDIVCASVSVLVINTVNSLEEIAKEQITVETDEEQGIISCKLKNGPNEAAKVLLNSLVLGLSQIEKQYGKQYCKLKFEEV